MLEIFVIPIVLILISLFWIVFPPKNRNQFYGYRTSTSLRSEENWYWGNFISSRTLLILSLGILLIHLLAFHIMEKPTNNLINFLVISYLIIIFMVIPITEVTFKMVPKPTDHQE